MMPGNNLRLLFVINANSGNNTTDWDKLIRDYFEPLDHTIELYHLTADCRVQTLKDKIKLFLPQQVIAVGGDGTVKMVAGCLLQQNIALGIIPAGSANGLAKELGIGNDPLAALGILLTGNPKKIHATLINDHLCIHLSDIGLNAHAIKIFEGQGRRGMWGYLIAAIKVLWQKPMMEVELKIDKKTIKIKAELVVIANGTQYGSGAVINPIGQLDDAFFEVIAIKEVTVREILKKILFRIALAADQTELFQTDAFTMRSRKPVHFQVDGEYLGKVKSVKASILPDALAVMVPATI